EMRPDFTEKLDIVQIKQPVSIVHHKRFSLREIDKLAHLLLKAVTVVLNLFRCHHTSHICSSGRITDISCSSSDQGDRLISRFLKAFHKTQRHKMPYMKAVSSRIKSDIEYRFPVIHQFSDFFLIRHLGDQSSRLKFFINSHLSSPFLFP